MNERHFGMTDWQAVRQDMLQVLKEIARRRETVSYSEFGRMLANPMHHRNPALYDLLRDICYDEHEAGRPDLCSMVVRKSDGMPGKGYFEYSGMRGENVSDPRAYWEANLHECWDYYAQEGDES